MYFYFWVQNMTQETKIVHFFYPFDTKCAYLFIIIIFIPPPCLHLPDFRLLFSFSAYYVAPSHYDYIKTTFSY